MITQYFGTDLSSAWHYLWNIDKRGLSLDNKDYRFATIPFSPEYITENMHVGSVIWWRTKGPMGEFTMCGIVGSCVDTRGGCKSIFIFKGDIGFDELKEMIFETPICKTIIEMMEKKFKIDW